jgi:hypothetical protein
LAPSGFRSLLTFTFECGFRRSCLKDQVVDACPKLQSFCPRLCRRSPHSPSGPNPKRATRAVDVALCTENHGQRLIATFILPMMLRRLKLDD